MYYGTLNQALLQWAETARNAIAHDVRTLGAGRVADAVMNHQPHSLDLAMALLFDPDAQDTLRDRARAAAEAAAREQQAYDWERELCLSAIALHGAPHRVLGTDRAGRCGALTLNLNHGDKALRALLIGIAAGDNAAALATLRAQLCRSLCAKPYRPACADKGRAMAAEPTPCGTVVAWHEAPRAHTPEASPQRLAMGPDARKPWLVRIPGRTDAPEYRSYRIVVAEPATVAPNRVAISVDALTTMGRADWLGQYPELYREPLAQWPESSQWIRYAPSAGAVNPLLANGQQYSPTIHPPLRATRPATSLDRDCVNWNTMAYSAMEYLDALMDGPGLLGTMAAEWVAELASASRRGWDKFDTRQAIHGALHFIQLECGRLARWGCEDSAETKQVAMAMAQPSLTQDDKLLLSLPKVTKPKPCRRRKCDKLADYSVNRNFYCRTHALQIAKP